jgi:hypothetical protein
MNVRSNVLPLLTTENSVLWDVKTCGLLETYQRLGGTLWPKEGGSRFFRWHNVA